MNTEQLQALTAKVQEWITLYGLKIIAAIIILIVGRWLAKAVRGILRRSLIKRQVDDTIISFICDITYVGLLVFVVIAALSNLGIQTATFVAVVGAAGLAIGLALQGSLANFAAGFLRLVFKPFKAGDFVDAGGTMGMVEEVQIFTTHLKTPDNKKVIVPNGKIMSDNITNFSAKETRRVDLVVGVGYDADLKKARAVMEEILKSDDRVLDDPGTTIGVSELADSSVNFVVRPWVKTADYWSVLFDFTEKVKERFDQEGISIPFPQRDVHLYEHKG
jgi:small conductance mechanosensitive channel